MISRSTTTISKDAMSINPLDHLDFLRARRSRRLFTDQPVAFDAIERALEAATWAPSGANSQPWEFVLIPPGDHRKTIEDMARVADQRFHDTAPQWLKDWMQHHLVSVEKIYFDKAPWLICIFSRRNLPYWLPSVWLGIANLVNQLEAEGLQSVTYTPTLGKDFNTMVGVDPEWSFQAMLPVGIADPSETVKERPREPVESKTMVYSGESSLPLKDWQKLQAQRIDDQS